MKNVPHLALDWARFHDKAKPLVASVVIVYNDMHAALRAAQMLERLREKLRGKMEPQLRPVPLGQLYDPACYEHAVADATTADMIIVSFNGAGGLPEVLKQWVQDCTARQHEGEAAVVALLGSMAEADDANSPRLNYLKNAALRAGLDFFAPREGMDGQMEAQELPGVLQAAG